MDRESELELIKQARAEAKRAQGFARELAMLTHKYQIGIAGDPDLFLLERDDSNLAYSIDVEGKLRITSA